MLEEGYYILKPGSVFYDYTIPTLGLSGLIKFIVTGGEGIIEISKLDKDIYMIFLNYENIEVTLEQKSLDVYEKRIERIPIVEYFKERYKSGKLNYYYLKLIGLRNSVFNVEPYDYEKMNNPNMDVDIAMEELF